MTSVTRHWIGHVIQLGLLVSAIAGYVHECGNTERAENALVDAQCGWFVARPEVSVVDTGFTKLIPTDSVVSGPNLGERVPIMLPAHKARMNVLFTNQGTEAAFVDMVAACDDHSEKMVLWEQLLSLKDSVKTPDGYRVSEANFQASSGPIIQTKETTSVSIPMVIWLPDSAGHTIVHAIVITRSVPHEHYALSYLWVDVVDPYRRQGLVEASYDPSTRQVTVPKYECRAHVISQKCMPLYRKEQRKYLKFVAHAMKNDASLQGARMRLLSGEN